MTLLTRDLTNIPAINNPTHEQIQRFLGFENTLKDSGNTYFAGTEQDRIEYSGILRGWLNEAPAVLKAFKDVEDSFPF